MSETVTTAVENAPPWVPIPNYPTGYPSPKRKLGQAWAMAWDALGAVPSGEYLDGVELARRTAEAVGLNPTTMISLFTRAATAGKLERAAVKVDTTKGPRTRTHYRRPA